MWSCNSEQETTVHNVFNLDQTLRNYDNDRLIYTLFYGSEKLNFNLNKEIITLTVFYLKDTERFIESLIWNIYCFFIINIDIVVL